MSTYDNDERIIDYDTFTQFIRNYWKTEELKKLLIQFEDELEGATKETKDTDSYEMIILRITAKCLITMREIIILCEAGYSDGAFSLARNLYEQLIHVLFFMKHENEPEFNNFVDDYYLNGQYQIIKYNKEKASRLQNRDELSKLQKEENELMQKTHHKYPDKGTNDYWWAGKNSFYGLVKDVKEKCPNNGDQKILDRLQLYYIATNRSIHANSAGNAQRLGNNYASYVIDTAPNAIGQGFPLHFATLCLCVVISRTCQIFGMNFQYYKSELNKMTIYYSKTIAENAQ